MTEARRKAGKVAPRSRATFWWSVTELARHWKIHRVTLRGMIRRGEVVAHAGPGSRYLIADAEVCRHERTFRTVSEPESGERPKDREERR